MDAIESKMSSMQDLFELERKRTEDLLAKERTERLAQEEKVRQLEEDLTEQRRVAVSSKQEAARRRTMADDEVRCARRPRGQATVADRWGETSPSLDSPTQCQAFPREAHARGGS